MAFTKEKIFHGLVGAILSGISFLLISIYSDLLPEIMPAFLNIPTNIYLKLIALLFLLIILSITVAIVLYQKSKEYKPLVLKGTDFGYNWSALIDYEGKRKKVDIELQWLCPKHKVFLGAISAEIPETTYHVLWCMKCNHKHIMEEGGDQIYLEEARKIVERNILQSIKIK